MNAHKSQQKHPQGHRTNISNIFTLSPNKKRERTSIDSTLVLPKKHCEEDLSSLEPEPDMEALQAMIKDSFEKAAQEQKEFRNEINSALKSINETLQTQIDSQNARLTAVESSHDSFKKQIKDLQQEIESLKAQASHNSNKNDQKDLENDVVAFGLPSLYSSNVTGLLTILNQKLNISLSNQSVTVKPLKPRQHSHTTTYFLKFATKALKADFMSNVDKFRNKDVITMEDLFEQYNGTNHAGKTISFKNSLTKFNKNLLAAAQNERRAGKNSIRLGKRWQNPYEKTRW